MRLRTCLQVAIILTSFAYEITAINTLSEYEFYTSPKDVIGGNAFDLYCVYNFATSNSGDLQLKTRDNVRLETVPIGDNAIKYSVNQTSKEGEKFSFLLYWSDHYIATVLFAVLPLLDVRDFKCQYTDTESDTENELNCGFSDVGIDFYWPSKSYFLSMDDGPKHECILSLNIDWMQCKLPYPLNRATLNHTFTLELIIYEFPQQQVFPMTDSQMKMPAWPIYPYLINTVNYTTCIYGPVAYSEVKLKWQALLLPRNPRIDEMKVKVYEKMDQHCFEIPRFQNQTYEVRLWCAYDNDHSPWTSDYYARQISTEASVPDRPPVFLGNGFFYNSEERTLLVFWQQLHKVEYTAPDFAYIVQSDLGKQALIVSNNSAIFLDWDPSRAATISVWSQNSLGRSVNSSELKVPILTHSERRQAQELEYHLKTDIMSWRPPKDEENLTDYVVFWCSASKNHSQFCDDTRPLKKKRVEKSLNELHFNESVAQYNKAVVARYRDNSGGGMQWIGPSFPEKPSNIFGLGIGIVLLLAVLARLFIVCFRRLQKCKQIEVELPVGILDSMDGGKKSCSVEKPDTPPIITFPASVSPKGLIDIKSFTAESSIDKETPTIFSPYVSVGPGGYIKNIRSNYY